jgi:hypothetical protein
VGLVLTFVGFGLTIWQLRRTRTAVAAANDAAQSLREKIASQTATVHAVAAIARLKAAKRELRSREWAAAQFILEELRQALVIIERRKQFSSEEFVAELPQYLKDLMDFIDYIDSRGEVSVTDRKKNQMLSRLNELSNSLEKIADDLAENVR